MGVGDDAAHGSSREVVEGRRVRYRGYGFKGVRWKAATAPHTNRAGRHAVGPCIKQGWQGRGETGKKCSNGAAKVTS